MISLLNAILCLYLITVDILCSKDMSNNNAIAIWGWLIAAVTVFYVLFFCTAVTATKFLLLASILITAINYKKLGTYVKP